MSCVMFRINWSEWLIEQREWVRSRTEDEEKLYRMWQTPFTYVLAADGEARPVRQMDFASMCQAIEGKLMGEINRAHHDGRLETTRWAWWITAW